LVSEETYDLKIQFSI